MKPVLLQRGESEWNRDNRFTNSTSMDPLKEGINETRRAARLLRNAGHTFDVTYTSAPTPERGPLWLSTRFGKAGDN